ncbi:sn-glycerol-3-phosphate ABC transporter permease UgpA [Candidimonas nitroreducens]|uniref:sn-glycerol-3-phosphate transport system permease protein UgpA n=1 Tax=Candidimonas nitroreducens TaxID=683354 RepID=A0A225MYN9_9BURK|nr:sn-glycerol-3-phosphate ABC transporter permease UgpA [Candidimonas nitroreducens]OWT66335.1 glycerol-3-phosphate transporter permease [Candidimonas nitroreducens]
MEKRARFKSHWLPYALVAPQIIVSLVFFFWPAIEALYQSVLMQDAFGLSSQFAGLDNFRDLLQDSSYLASFKTTAIFSVCVAFLGMTLSMILAAFADRALRGSAFYRTLLIWPYAVAPVVVGTLWAFMLSPGLGIIAVALEHIGIHWDSVLNGTDAMILIVIAAIWKQLSYNFLFFLAGLQSIPKSLVEAAAIDGAGPVKRFVTIVFPLLSPTTFFLLVMNVVYAFFDTFGIIDATTQGGPQKDTQILVYKVFFDGFRGGDIGSSAAQSVILMAVVITLTVLQFKYVERKVQYS